MIKTKPGKTPNDGVISKIKVKKLKGILIHTSEKSHHSIFHSFPHSNIIDLMRIVSGASQLHMDERYSEFF